MEWFSKFCRFGADLEVEGERGGTHDRKQLPYYPFADNIIIISRRSEVIEIRRNEH